MTCSNYNRANHELKLSLLGAPRLKPIGAQKRTKITEQKSIGKTSKLRGIMHERQAKRALTISVSLRQWCTQAQSSSLDRAHWLKNYQTRLILEN